MVGVWRIAVVLAWTALLACASARAETRLALVIGNSNYKSVTALPNPVHDAEAIANDLREAAFDVTQAPDLGQSDMRRAIRDFAAKVSTKGPDTIALVFYAGHGVQVDGENFLIPVDARIQREADIPIEAVRLADLMNALSSVPSKMRIVILDACRNNPFATGKQARGLAIVDAPTGSIVAYSTAPGTEATDGAGANSPYTTAFLEVSKEPRLQIEQVFKQVRRKVHDATKGQQTPWESSSLTSDFWFLPADEAAPAPVVASATPAVPSATRQPAQLPDTPQQTAAVEPSTPPSAPPAPPPSSQPAIEPPLAAQPVPTAPPGQIAAAAGGPPGYATPAPPPPIAVADMATLPPDDAYDFALDEDSVPAYEQFLLIYPNDPRAVWVRTALALRVDAIAWRYAAVVNTPVAYEAYLARYPGGIYADEATRLRLRPRLRPIDTVIAPRMVVAPPVSRIALPLIQMRRAPGVAVALPVVLSRPGNFNPRTGPSVPAQRLPASTNPSLAPGRLNGNGVTAAPGGPQFRPGGPGGQPGAAAVGPRFHQPIPGSQPGVANAGPQFRPGVPGGQPGVAAVGPRFHQPIPGSQPGVANAGPQLRPVVPGGQPGAVHVAPQFRPAGPPPGAVRPLNAQIRPVPPHVQVPPPRAAAAVRCSGKDCARR